MRNIPKLAKLLVATAFAAACARDDAASERLAVRDSTVVWRGSDLTVRIVENATADASLPRWTLAPSPAIDIGGADATAENALYRVRGAYRLDDGRIVVGDGGSYTIKVFTSDGELAGTIGGPGEGPGEFRAITHFARMPGDSLLVWDIQLARTTIFDPNGVRVREFRIGASPESPMSNVNGVFDDHSLLSRGFVSGNTLPQGLMRIEAELLHLTRDGTLADSLGSTPGGEAYFVSIENGFSLYTPPFARNTYHVAAGDRLIIADNEHAAMRVLTPSGMPQMIVRWQPEPRPVTDADIAQAKERALAENDNDFNRPHIERMFREMPMPQHMPVFGDVRADRAGNLWVQSYRTERDEGDARWLIFSRDGELIADAMLPGTLSPTDIGEDYVLGVERDELEVERVRLYRLTRDTAS